MGAIASKKILSLILVFSILFSNFSFVFSQQETSPERYIRELNEIEFTVSKTRDTLEKLNEALMGCSCAKARSVCYGGLPGGGLFSFEFPYNKEVFSFKFSSNGEKASCPSLREEDIVEFKKQISAKIEEVRENLKKIEEKMNEMPEEVKNRVSDQISDVRNKVNDLRNELNKIEEALKSPPDELKNQVDELRNRLESSINSLENSIKNLEEKIQNLPEDLKRQFEESLNDILNEIERIYEEQIKSILDIFESFSNILKILGCHKLPVTSDPFSRSDLEKIKKYQSEITVLKSRLSFLEKLLKKELDTGLKYELPLETLEKIETVLSKLETFDRLVPSGPFNCSIENCVSVCRLEPYFQLPALCFGAVGQQKPIRIIFEVGVKMPEKWDLGKIGVRPEFHLSNIRLNPVIRGLKIHFHPRITTTTIPVGVKGDIKVNLGIKTPSTLGLKFTCPKHAEGKTTSDLGIGGMAGRNYIEAQRYFEIFSYLSSQCQDLPGMNTYQYGFPLPTSDLFENCFNPEKVHLTIIEACNEAIEKYCRGLLPEVAIPQFCQKVYSAVGMFYCDILGQPNTLPFSKELKRVQEIIKKCEDENLQGVKEVSEECKMLPVITGEFPIPKELAIRVTLNGEENGPTAIISPSEILLNFPSTLLGCEHKPTIPRLKLPKIVLPDFDLGEFKIPPFLYVRLPRIIIEDLDFNPAEPIRDSGFVREIGYEEGMRLCDLNQCLANIENIFSQFVFRGLFFPLPSISLPPIEIGGGGGLQIPWLKISLGDISFPSLSFPGSYLNFGKFLSLILQLPSFNLPLPTIYIKFKKIEIDVKGIILAMIRYIIGKLFGPFPSGCIAFKLPIPIPIVIDLGDYYIYFPIFHKIREILGNILCRLTGYCEKLAKKLEEVLLEKKKIEDELEKEGKKISKQMEEVGKEVVKDIEVNLSSAKEKFKKDFEEHVRKNAKKIIDPSTGKEIWVIPPFEKDYGEIGFDEISLIDYGKSRRILPRDFMPELDLTKYESRLNSIASKISFEYPLFSIDLSKLSYHKEIPIALGSFQTLDFKLELPGLACEPESPRGSAGGGVGLGNIRQIEIEIAKIIEEIKGKK